MSSTNLSDKIEQFNEFFSIEHQFTVNITQVVNNVPSYDAFMAQIPLPFQIASEVATLEPSALRSIQGINSVANQLAEFLSDQNKKINLLIGYILSQQDHEEHRYQGIKFGGGGIIFTASTAFNVHDFLEMKVFLLEENCAIYCLGEVININKNPSNGDFEHQVIFHYIREEDREILVRASLHEQAKQLQKLAKQRHQNSQTEINKE